VLSKHTMNDLPLELVREILRFSSKADLATLSSVNATLNEIATPLLYVVLAAKNLSRMLRALRTLRAKPQLARFVRIFRLPDGTVFKSALRIVAESLRMMENLVELSLCLGGQYTYVLHGCISTPRVVDFSFVYDRHLGEWLRRSGQNIEDFRMLNLEQPVFTSPVSNSLPSVTSVYAVPQLIIALAGDRPIREAGILAVNGDWSHLTLAALLSSLATLSRSSSTVRTIMIATHIMFFVDAIIYFLPKCRVLKLHMLWTAIPSDKV
jgi:hypothetical protein